jgi:hypothetical protein
MKAIKNVVELRNDLLSVYTDLRSGKLGTDEAKQAANVSGKILSTAKVQLEYNKMVQSKERIPFLEPGNNA